MNILNKDDFARPGTLNLEQFFTLECSPSHQHPVIWQKRQPYEIVWRVYHCAKTIVDDWHCDWLEMGKTDDFFTQCDRMYQEWDYNLMESLQVCVDDRSHLLENGHHRSFVLGSLLLQGKVEFQPVPVLNTSLLTFNTTSEKSIEVQLSIPEFLAVKIAPGIPIGTLPERLRMTNLDLYKSHLTAATEMWKERIKGSPPPHSIRTKIENIINNLTHDVLIIDATDRQIALAAAFICDAIYHQIQAGNIFFAYFDPVLIIHPPYVMQ